MKKKHLTITAVALAGALGLSACGDGGGRGGTDEDAEGGGFAEDAVIGVALPWLGTQNWAEAQEMFQEELTEAGFQPMIQAADNRATQQQQQIEAMVESGAEVIVVGPVDGTQLGSVLESAADAGIEVIGYDRLIENTEAVDAVVQFGSIRTGELQGQSLLDGLAERKGEPPYNVELFGGGPADPNAPNFFTGAMSVLQPEIDAGNLVVASGQVDFAQAATPDWDNGEAQSRMDSLLSGFYSNEDIDGALSPNDGIGRAILTSAQQAGQDTPVVTGLDAETESVRSIWEGEQWSTVHKPTVDLVGQTVELIQTLQRGEELPEPSEMEDNGVKEVAIYALDPVVVTQDNAEEVFADDDTRLELLQ